MLEFTTAKNEAQVVINLASFANAVKLKDAIEYEVSQTDFKVSFDDINKDAELNLGKIIQIAMKVDSSKVVSNALFDCLIKCTYNGSKITVATFEDEKARFDYYEIAISCVKENLLPFAGGLLSKLNGIKNILQLITPK